MRITKSKSVKACSVVSNSNAKQDAVKHIKAAMDCLAMESDDVSKDSIANLSVVMIDLCPQGVCDTSEFQNIPGVEPVADCCVKCSDCSGDCDGCEDELK